MRRTRWTFWVIIAVCLLPLVTALAGMGLAGLLGCEVTDNYRPEPCGPFGIDISGFVSALVFSGWFGLFTLPALGLAVVLWAAVEAFAIWRRQRRTRKTTSGGQEL